MLRHLTLLCLLSIDAFARDVPPNPAALKACAIERKPSEPVDAWVNRGLEEMKAYAPWASLIGMSCKGTDLVKCAIAPGRLRMLARGACKLADAWEWGGVMGQPLEERSGGWRLRAESAARSDDWMLTQSQRLRDLLGNAPTRVITTPCASEPDPGGYHCLLAELPKAMTLDEVSALQSKSGAQKLRIEDVWPAGKPEQGLLGGALRASCKALADLAAPDSAAAYEAAVAAAKKPGFNPDIAAALRTVVNVTPDDRRDIINASARDLGFTGECFPRITGKKP